MAPDNYRDGAITKSSFMCFYYSINKTNADTLAKKGIVSKDQLGKIPHKTLVNGFERPTMPVVSSKQPKEISFYQWGMVPSTVNSGSEANEFLKTYNTLNAKSESVFKSKVYSNPILTQRCLVLASGFFEWQHVKGKKYPYYISLKDESLFAFAGIWDSWFDELGKENYTYSILTTQANELMAKIHNSKKRMPLILPFHLAREWINPKQTTTEIASFFEPLDSNALKAHTIRPFLSTQGQSVNEESLLEPYKYPELSKGNNPSKESQLSIDW